MNEVIEEQILPQNAEILNKFPSLVRGNTLVVIPLEYVKEWCKVLDDKELVKSLKNLIKIGIEIEVK